ncbi:MAG: glycosyltransferase, partial [Anaerolineales bacterium]|nr:glycosyltransferase [Anaerolineales bacterium]
MTDTLPTVSLIIPAYHSQDTIATSLQTFLAQDYPAIEIIIVDSSPDSATEQALEPVSGNYRYHHHPSRLLPHAARNQGVGLA